MVVLNEGLNRVRDMVSTDIDKGQLGTGTTASSDTDTSLETADATTLLTLDNKSSGDKSLRFDYILPSTGGTSTTYSEYELYSDGSSTDYDRVVFTGIAFTKDGSEDINITKLYFFDQT